MADEMKDGPQRPEPPLIKLTGAGFASSQPPAGGVPHAPKPLPVEPAKKSTTRVGLPERVMTEEEKRAAAKKATARVQLEPFGARTATGVNPDTQSIAAAKRQTSRIDLRSVLQADQSAQAKKSTAAIPGIPVMPGAAPKTIRIRREDVAAPMPRLHPETGVSAPIPDVNLPKKSETSRIEVPPEVIEQPSSQRKTIRIKRSEGGSGGRPLILSSSASTESATDLGGVEGVDESELHPAFSVLALSAALVAMVLLYVLIAQVGTLDALQPPRLPFWGQG